MTMNQRILSFLGGVPDIDRSDMVFTHITKPRPCWQDNPRAYLKRYLPMLDPGGELEYKCIQIERTGARTTFRFLVEGQVYSLDGAIQFVECQLGLRTDAPTPIMQPPRIKKVNPQRYREYHQLSRCQKRVVLYYYDKAIGRDPERFSIYYTTFKALLNNGWIEQLSNGSYRLTAWAKEIVEQALEGRGG